MGNESEAIAFATRPITAIPDIAEPAEWCAGDGREAAAICAAFMRGLKPLIHCDAIALCRFEGDRMQVVLGDTTMTTVCPVGPWWPLAGSLAAECANQTRRLYVPDLTDRSHAPEVAWLLAAGFRSAITCPLIVDGSAIGAIYCLSKSLEEFEPGHAQVVAALADSFALVIHMSANFSTQQARVREFEALEAYEASLHQSLHLQEVLGVGLNRIVTAGGFDAGAIYLLESDGRRLSLGAASCQDAEFVEAVSRIEREVCAFDIVVSTGYPAVFTRREYPAALAAILSPERFGVIVSIPLRSKECVFGVVLLVRHHDEQPTTQALGFLESTAAILARVVDNRRLFEKVARAKREWQDTFDAMEDLVTLYDTHLRLMRANIALATRLGKLPADLIGAHADEIFGSIEDLPLRVCAHRASQAMLGAVTKELVLPTLNGTFVITASPLRDHNGGVVGYVQVAKDVTELKRLEEEARAKQRLDDISRAKSTFIASLSHELRVPLNTILGFSQLLRDGTTDSPPVTGKQARFVGSIIRGGEHLRNLINDTLDLSKIEAGKIRLQLEPRDIAELIDSVSDLIRPIAEKKRIRLERGRERDLPLVLLDPLRLKQVFYNLLSNAIKFTPEGGRVMVMIRRGRCIDRDMRDSMDNTVYPDDAVEVVVTDTGIGIAQEDQAKLFLPFSQLHGTAEREGSGLGLMVAKQLVELHGGRISVTSNGEGQGSTFTVHLPLAPPGAGTATHAQDDSRSHRDAASPPLRRTEQPVHSAA